MQVNHAITGDIIYFYIGGDIAILKNSSTSLSSCAAIRENSFFRSNVFAQIWFPPILNNILICLCIQKDSGHVSSIIFILILHVGEFLVQIPGM